MGYNFEGLTFEWMDLEVYEKYNNHKNKMVTYEWKNINLFSGACRNYN